MDDEMVLRYLYFLTHMYSGTEHWEKYYQAWKSFGEQNGEYSELIDKVVKFKKKYRTKKLDK